MGFLNELEDKHSQETPKKEDPAKPASSIGFLGELESKHSGEVVSAPPSFLGELEQKNDTDPTSLRERQSRGEPLSIEQERVVFDANRARNLGEEASAVGKGVFASLSEMVPKAFEGTKKILKATDDLAKQIGVQYLDVNPIVPEIAVNYLAGNTAEERKADFEKAAKNELDTIRSAASGAVQAGEEVINEAARGAFFGTPLTDLIQEYPAGKFAYETMKAGGPVALASEAIVQKISGEPLVDLQPITKDESFQRSLNRESMRQQEQQEYKDLPERTTAALVKLAESSAGSLLGKSLGVPSDEQFQKDLVQELKNNAITPDEDVALVGNMLSPLDPTFVLAGPLARASSKAFDLASEAGLRGLTKPTIAGMNPLEATGRVIRFGGEGAQKAARKFSDFLTGSEDSFIGKLADPIVAVTRRPGMIVEGAGRALRDVGRQIDDAGVRSRMGIIERAGQDARSGDFMRTVFGPGTEKAQAKALKASEKLAEEGSEMGAASLASISKRRAAARTADWVFRQAEAVARYGTSGAAIGTALGLPDIENAEALGQTATTGAMVGAIGGARLGEKAAKIVDPRVSLKGKIDAILADDPVSRRADEDADIERFRNTASPDLINKANEFGNINSVLQSFDGHIQNLANQRDQAIARGEQDVAAGIDLEIKKANDSKDAVSKMTPDAMKEYQRRVDLTLADALDQAKTTGEAVGLNNIEVKLLSPVEMLAHLRNKWGSTLDNAEYILKSLAGNNDLSDQDQQKLNEARETINQFNSMYQTAMGQRGYAMSDNTYSDSPQHLRPANLKTPSVVINSELVKSQLGNNLYGTLVHEINHALRNFKEVKSMMAPLEEYLFGKKVQNADGSITEISKGIYDDAAIDRMGDYYAELLGGDKWKAGFATEGQFRNYIKEEILAEASGLSSNTANLRADLDSPGQAFIDWAATSNKNSLIGKLRDALGLKGVLLDESGRISDILGETISPEVLALTRQYQRQLRDYNGSLSQITSSSGPEVTISTPELLSSKILQNKYRGLDIWQKEQVLTIKDDEGNVVNEIVVPQSASLNALVGQYRLEGGMLVDENGNKMQIAPEIAAANLPNNTNISVDQRIARNPDGSPKILSNREIQARARKRGAVLKNAIEGAMEDGSTNRLRPVGDNEYAGILSPTQLQAILELPNEIVPTELKRKIAAFNETALRKDGTRMIVEYQAALKGGKYKALAPKIRDVVPFGFRITNDGNFLATTISVSRIFDKINDWAKPNRNRLNLWNGDTNALWEDILHVLKNHQKGERGEVGLDVDPEMAVLKKNRINDIFNLFDKATESKNPDRSVSKTRKGQDSIDRVIMGMRMDRVNDFAISNAQKLPVDYGKIKENYMPNVPVDPVEDLGFSWPKEVDDAIVRVRSVLENPDNMPTQVKPEAPLPVSLYEAGTSLESFGLNSLKEIAEHYGFTLPEKAKRGEIIDLVENQRSDVQFQPPTKGLEEEGGLGYKESPTNEYREPKYETTNPPRLGFRNPRNSEEGQRVLRESPILATAFDALDRAEAASGDQSQTSGSGLKPLQEEALRKFAQESGVMETPENVSKWGEDWAYEGRDAGTEHQTLLGSGERISKRSNAPWHNWRGYLERILLHNMVFPETAPKLEKFHDVDYRQEDINGKKWEPGLYVETSQPFIYGRHADPAKEIKPYMESLGFVSDGPMNYYNPETGIHVKDLHPGNASVVKDANGNWDVKIFDPMIHLTGTEPGDAQVRARVEAKLAAEGPQDFGTAIERAKSVLSRPENMPTQFKPAAKNSGNTEENYPTNEKGFYSGLQKTIDEKMPAKASPEQILSIVNNPQNAKADEVKWSNLAGYLEGKTSVTKQEVLDYLKNEGSVKFEERTLANEQSKEFRELQEEKREILKSSDGYNYTTEQEKRLSEIDDRLNRLRKGETKYSQYVLPNGENYREVVLAMPASAQEAERAYNDYNRSLRDKYGVYDIGPVISEKEREVAQKLYEKINEGYRGEYTSSHFQDIPNYVAHMRLNERPDAEGRKGLFIEEIQSDRHQQGREKGYKEDFLPLSKEEQDRKTEIRKKIFELEDQGVDEANPTPEYEKLEKEFVELAKRDQGGSPLSIPDAPFRKDWPVQMFKRALRDAIEGDMEWIGWTKGETQAERFDLSKQVTSLNATRLGNGIVRVKGVLKDTTQKFDEEVPEEKLSDTIGKDLARQVMDTPVGKIRSFLNTDLKIGGEGMTGFYDQILTKEIGKYVKKWGAKVEDGDIKTNPNEYDTTPIWKVKVTPEMRSSIKEGGQIAFKPSTKIERAEEIKIAPGFQKAPTKNGKWAVYASNDLLATGKQFDTPEAADKAAKVISDANEPLQGIPYSLQEGRTGKWKIIDKKGEAAASKTFSDPVEAADYAIALHRESLPLAAVKKFMLKADRDAVTEAEQRIADMQAKNPEAMPLVVARDGDTGLPKIDLLEDAEGNPVLDDKGKQARGVIYRQVPYRLRQSPMLDAKDDNVAVQQAADLMTPEVQIAMADPSVAKAIGWYKKMRQQLQQYYGANIELFGQLLGATSARTPVDENFKQTIEAARQYSKGAYDTLLQEFHEHIVKATEDLASGALQERWEKKNPTKTWNQEKDGTDALRMEINKFSDVPLRSNGKKFNANSQKVLHALYGNWLSQTVGPKTPNFAGNLTGRTLRATIDVWAARNLRRLLYDDGTSQWRLLPEQEKGVDSAYNAKGELTGDFPFAQNVYDVVADRVNMNADDLQALMWFYEKGIWDQNGWTGALGAKKSSFEEEAEKLSLDRYQAGVTAYTNEGDYPNLEEFTSGVQEKTRKELRDSIGQLPGVEISRVTHTDGLYGGSVEPSLDVEFSVSRDKEGKPQSIASVIDRLKVIGKEQNQYDTFISQLVDKEHPNARPMVEIGFKNAAKKQEVDAVVKAFRDAGIDGFTLAKDSKGNVIGIRAQYIPEISSRWDEDGRADILDPEKHGESSQNWADKARQAINSLGDQENVSYKNEGYVSTHVYGKEEYDAETSPQDLLGSDVRDQLGRRKRILEAPAGEGQVSSGIGSD